MTTASSGSDRRLLVATLNRGKARELAGLLADPRFDIVAFADLPGARLPEETGATYAENALIKARAAWESTGLRTIADDSGLEVDALAGAPGIHSARYGGPGLDDAARIARLLEALRDVPDEQRGARFRCVIALITPDGREQIAEGAVEGRIARAPRGANGFGYDPVFVFPPLGRTFAELSPEDKHRADHRGVAVRALRRVLE